MPVNPCAVIDALGRFNYNTLVSINRKFAALQRLAALLESLGDLSALVPNLSIMVPVPSIDLSVYTNIALACPFLHLPAPGAVSLADLQARLAAAYAGLFKGVRLHPWSRMGELQAEMAKFQSKINYALGTSINFLACLQAACQSFSAAAGLFSSVSATDVQAQLSKFASGFGASGGQVLTASMQAKAAQVAEAQSTLMGLGASVNDDYANVLAARQQVAAATAPAPPSTTAYPNPPFVPPPAS